MSRVALSALVFAAVAYAQSSVPTFPATPLISFSFPHPTDAPEQVYGPDRTFVRGPQSGYNRCNSTTENQNSLCQTSFVNDITDFCLWAPQTSNSTIADTEGEEVAWCTKKGHGTRIMLDGTLQGIQVLNTPDYTMITGLIDQTKVNIQSGDAGGELDSGGQDTAGNPIGGLMYSTRFSPNNAGQIIHWTEFIGNNQFCIKICKNDGTNPEGFCQHTLDRIGLGFNCPSKYTLGGGTSAGTFEVCDSDNMIVPGIYTLPGGTTTSYAQPPESLGPIQTVPYTPVAAASSNCVTSASSALYTDLLTVSTSATPSASGSATGSAGTTKATGSGAAASGSASRSGSASGANSTGASQSGADALHMSMVATALGTLFAVAFFA
ncbi:hypothetical protein BDY19DRAFT_991511 [Irpex rosettiformis]|uniref:Uncharacterized protein n=1 Tax=Irpex rosettiformis TaxID=378272 RepID=A0ACB8U9J1_9APHY|nr:hypothetical protein BDY19DRAFT_991511 [Irpex rosettiformis]